MNVVNVIFVLFVLLVFCDSIPVIVKKITNLVSPLHATLSLRGIKASDPERARCAHLARSGSQSVYRIHSILPTRAVGCIIRFIT